nr:MAG TPA: hypothetical protein [Caudoviricetes sp.]
MKKNAAEILFFIALISVGYYIWMTILRAMALGMALLFVFAS